MDPITMIIIAGAIGAALGAGGSALTGGDPGKGALIGGGLGLTGGGLGAIAGLGGGAAAGAGVSQGASPLLGGAGGAGGSFVPGAGSALQLAGQVPMSGPGASILTGTPIIGGGATSMGKLAGTAVPLLAAALGGGGQGQQPTTTARVGMPGGGLGGGRGPGGIDVIPKVPMQQVQPLNLQQRLLQQELLRLAGAA